MGYAIFTGANGSKFVGETGFGEIVARISKRSGAVITSHARERAARPWLNQIGKHDQEYLYDGWVHRRPGFNPANPPGRSTHERRNDGVAYPGPVGMRLAKHQRGIDCVPSGNFVREAAREGYTVTVTYPHSRAEAHHVNFRKAPKIDLWKSRPLHGGEKRSTGRRVRFITRALTVIRDPDTHQPYLTEASNTFTDRVEEAVKAFQRDHSQKADGVVGVQTRRQIGASLRYWEKRK